MNEKIKQGAVQYATYITDNISQTSGENLQYYISGSLAMLLLSSAKTIKPVLFDKDGNMVSNSPVIQVTEEASNAFSQGVRPISIDIDMVAVNEKVFNGTTRVYHLGAVKENCDLATILCPSWEKYGGTMYFDILSDERNITKHNVTIVELNNGKKVVITNPIDLMFHKFSEMPLMNLNSEAGMNKYNKDTKDFTCMFNGLSKIGMLPKNFKEYFQTLTTINEGSAINRFEFTDYSEQLTRMLTDILPYIDGTSKSQFEQLINQVKEFNKEQISKQNNLQ